jgi:hypothetical protein
MDSTVPKSVFHVRRSMAKLGVDANGTVQTTMANDCGLSGKRDTTAARQDLVRNRKSLVAGANEWEGGRLSLFGDFIATSC